MSHHGHDNPDLAHHFDTPEQQFETGKLGMWLFLVTEVLMLMFGGLFVLYAYWRYNHIDIFLYSHHYLDWKLGALNTAILLASSWTMAMAVRAAQKGAQKQLVWLLVFTLLGGAGFFAVKSVEYGAKFDHGLYPGKRNLYYPLDQLKTKEITRYDARGDEQKITVYEGLHVDPHVVLHQLHLEAPADLGHDKVAINNDVFWGAWGLAPRDVQLALIAHLEHEQRAKAHGGDHGHGDAHDEAHGDHGDDAAAASTEEEVVTLSGVKTPEAATGGVTDAVLDGEPLTVKQLGRPDFHTVHELPDFTTLPPSAQKRVHLFFQVYYMMTGLHGLHVAIGMGVILWLTILAAKKRFKASYYDPVDIGGLYWHIVDLIWIFLFPLLYLIH